jgi:hypothetical protein
MRAAAEFAHDAVAVGVVDDEHRAVLVAELPHGGEVGDGAFHAEDAVGNDPDLTGDFGVLAGGFESAAEAAFAFELVVGVDGLVQAFLDGGGEADSSLMMMSPGSQSVGKTASLAVQALTNEYDDSVPMRRAISRSRSQWGEKVPQMKRTLAVPAP